jgi:mxaJ protein
MRTGFATLIAMAITATCAAAQEDSLHSTQLKTGREVGVLRVCADPDNLPASSQAGEGYEIKVAELIAQTWGWRVEYAWWPVRRGFFSRALNGRYCDVAITAPSGLDVAGVTGPYFRSAYYIVYRKDSGLNLSSLADTAFRRLRIGVHILNSDAENTPPAMALSSYGVVGNLVGFPTNYSDIYRPDDIFKALGDSIDVAIVWGPIAGYFVQQSKVPLVMHKVAEDTVQGIPFVYSMGMGVRRRDTQFRDSLQTVIDQKRGDLEKILQRFNVPMLPVDAGGQPSAKAN